MKNIECTLYDRGVGVNKEPVVVWGVYLKMKIEQTDFGEVRELKDYKGYSVTSKGYVLHNGFPCQFKKLGKERKLGVLIKTGNKCRRLLVHKLVANTFLGEQPSDCNIYHKDGNKYNNNIENLGYRKKDWSKLKAIGKGNHHTVLKVVDIVTGTEQNFNSFSDFYNYLIDNKGYQFSYSTMYNKIKKVGVVRGFRVSRVTERKFVYGR